MKLICQLSEAPLFRCVTLAENQGLPWSFFVNFQRSNKMNATLKKESGLFGSHTQHFLELSGMLYQFRHLRSMNYNFVYLKNEQTAEAIGICYMCIKTPRRPSALPQLRQWTTVNQIEQA